MKKEFLIQSPEILQLSTIEESLSHVETNWKQIDDELDRQKIGRKDAPFDETMKTRMMTSYRYLNMLLEQHIQPFSDQSIYHMLELNNLVHYGTDYELRDRYEHSILNTKEKFETYIDPIKRWFWKHHDRQDHPLKIASTVYVGILGQPQLFIEGNHRTGSIIASWINVYYGYPPFILSVENAIPYFAPSAEIKRFFDKSTWRGRNKLPKYRDSFREFWEKHIDPKYLTSSKF